MSQWQYLGHAEPVLPTARTGSPAQVDPCLPESPLLRRGVVTALLVTAAAFVSAPAAAQPVLDWHVEQRVPSPRPAFARFEMGAARVLEVPQSQHITWAPEMPMGRERPRRRAVDFSTQAERVLEVPTSQHVTWEPEVTSGRERPVRRVVDFATHAERVLEVPASQHVTWWPQGEQNPRHAPRPVTHDTGAERPTRVLIAQLPDVSWQSPLTEQPRTPRRVAEVLTGAETPHPAITRDAPVDGWIGLGAPGGAAPQPRVVGETHAPVFVALVAPIALSWHPDLSAPQRRRVGPLADTVEPVRVDAAPPVFAPLPEPVRRHGAGPAETGAALVVVPPAPTAAEHMAWYVPLAEPVRTRGAGHHVRVSGAIGGVVTTAALTDRLSLDSLTIRGGRLGSVSATGAALDDATIRGGTLDSISIRMDP
jgi:hypothetical protein